MSGEKTGVMDVVRMYLPEKIRPTDGNAKPESQGGRAEVRVAAQQYFESGDKLYGDRMPETTILREQPHHRMMIYLHASGASQEDIAEQTGYTKAYVGQVLRQPWARTRLLQILNDCGKDRVKHFLTHEVAPSLEVLREIRDDKQARETARLTAANSILDRALGKPTVHVETDNTNRNVPQDMARLDQELKMLRQQINGRELDTAN